MIKLSLVKYTFFLSVSKVKDQYLTLKPLSYVFFMKRIHAMKHHHPKTQCVQFTKTCTLWHPINTGHVYISKETIIHCAAILLPSSQVKVLWYRTSTHPLTKVTTKSWAFTWLVPQATYGTNYRRSLIA